MTGSNKCHGKIIKQKWEGESVTYTVFRMFRGNHSEKMTFEKRPETMRNRVSSKGKTVFKSPQLGTCLPCFTKQQGGPRGQNETNDKGAVGDEVREAAGRHPGSSQTRNKILLR